MLFDSISIFLSLLFISTFTLVVAQDSTPDATPASSAPPDPSPWPTATVFLPGSLHELPGNGKHLAASIITANENQTAFAVGCMHAPVNVSTTGPQGCSLQSSITVTGGESTLIYTYNPIVTTDNGMPGTSDLANGAKTDKPRSGATINCNLVGGTRATAATCTSSSQISGLGLVGSSSTLASTQIDYATFTVTAGRAMLAEASEAAAKANGDGDEGAESGARGGKRGGVGGVVVALGLVSGLLIGVRVL